MNWPKFSLLQRKFSKNCLSFLVVKLVLCVPLCDLCVAVKFDLHRKRWLDSYFIAPIFQNY